MLLFIWTAPNDSLTQESRCLKISTRQVYAATDNLNAANFIGQGEAGKNIYDLVSRIEHFEPIRSVNVNRQLS